MKQMIEFQDEQILVAVDALDKRDAEAKRAAEDAAAKLADVRALEKRVEELQKAAEKESVRAKMMERAFKVQEEEVQDGLGQINALRSDREIAEREVETLRARLAALEASRPIPPGSPADAPDADAIAEKLQVAEAALAAKQAELERTKADASAARALAERRMAAVVDRFRTDLVAKSDELEKRVEGARREVAALAKTKGVIQERRKRLETEIERVAARQKNLAAIASSVREEIRRLDGAVASARGYLERDSRATDVDKIERETKRDASASLKKRVKTALETAAVTAEAAEKTHELTTRALRCKELHVQYEYFKDEWNTASETNNRLRDELRPAEERLRTLKQTARDLRVPAMEATNGRDPGKDAALEAKFAQWDDDLAILEESVRMIEDEADAIISAAALRHFAGQDGCWHAPCEAVNEGWIFGVPAMT